MCEECFIPGKNIHQSKQSHQTSVHLLMLKKTNSVYFSIPEAKSFQVDFPNVYVSTVGRSFYEQCLPSNSLHLGYSLFCMQWLSTKPCNITNGLKSYQSKIESERKSFKEQAAKDWELILLHRAAEMRSGDILSTI